MRGLQKALILCRACSRTMFQAECWTRPTVQCRLRKAHEGVRPGLKRLHAAAGSSCKNFGLHTLAHYGWPYRQRASVPEASYEESSPSEFGRQNCSALPVQSHRVNGSVLCRDKDLRPNIQLSRDPESPERVYRCSPSGGCVSEMAHPPVYSTNVQTHLQTQPGMIVN